MARIIAEARPIWPGCRTPSAAPATAGWRPAWPCSRNRARAVPRVEQDPGDLTAARRYLGFYLMGARDATVKFADLYSETQDRRARRLRALLTDLEANFAARTRAADRRQPHRFRHRIAESCATGSRAGVRMPDPAQPALEDRKESI